MVEGINGGKGIFVILSPIKINLKKLSRSMFPQRIKEMGQIMSSGSQLRVIFLSIGAFGDV